MLHSSVESVASGGSVPVHEKPSEGAAHPVTESSEAQVDGSPGMTMVAPGVQQNVPAVACSVQSPSPVGERLPVQLNPSSPEAQVTVVSEEHESVVTLAEQPAPVSKRDKNPRAMNQEIRMRVRLPAFPP